MTRTKKAMCVIAVILLSIVLSAEREFINDVLLKDISEKNKDVFLMGESVLNPIMAVDAVYKTIKGS